MWRLWCYSIDYTRMSPGVQTRQGIVSECPLCGRCGAMMRWTTRQGDTVERWLHLEQRNRLPLGRTGTFGCSGPVAGSPPVLTRHLE